MELILVIVLLVNAVMFSKIFGSMYRARFKRKVYMDGKYWTRIGFLIVFHVVMLIITLVTLYIGAIVRAAL